MNARRNTARRWVIDERKADEDVAHLIVVGYDEGPVRIEMEGYVNEAKAEVKWWATLEEAYRAGGYQPDLDLVADRLKSGPRRCGGSVANTASRIGATSINDSLEASDENGTFGVTQGKRETLH